MSRTTRAAAGVAAVALVAMACTKVPYTGRKAFNAIPEASLNSMGKSAYDQILGESKVTRGTDDAKRLRDVGTRISSAANKPEYDWSYSLINSADINAWCLPGGYIGFYDGILPVLESESGMSFVMGHEVGHALARHSGERMTQELGVTGALALVNMVLSGTGALGPKEQGTVMAVLGLGTEVGVLLPFSRAHEKEADVIGMMLMAESGYPPAESLKVWERMAAMTGGGGKIAILSTHPSSDARIENQKEWMTEARKKFRRAPRPAGDPLQKIW